MKEDGSRQAAGRLARRSLFGLVGSLGAGLFFVVLLALVASGSRVVFGLDSAAVDAINAVVSRNRWLVPVLHFVTHLGGAQASWVILPVTVAWLLVRRSQRLATYVAVTGMGALVLSWGVKALVERLRPIVEVAVAYVPGPSFPSGHALGSTVTYGVLILVFLPAVPVRFRRAVVLGAAALVGLIGVTRVALGVHYPSDVVAGWLLGVLWLGVTASAFTVGASRSRYKTTYSRAVSRRSSGCRSNRRPLKTAHCVGGGGAPRSLLLLR